MTQTRYTPKMARLMTAARHPLVNYTRGWRAERHPAVRNRDDSGMNTLTIGTTFSGNVVTKLLAGPKPELFVTGTGYAQRLRLTIDGRKALRNMPRLCIFCGCTDGMACAGGCSWVAKDVCSACAPRP